MMRGSAAPDAGSARGRHPAWLNLTVPSSSRPSTRAGRVLAALPPVLVLADAVVYLALGVWTNELADGVPGDVSPFVHAGLVALQAVALIWRHRAPLLIFGVVVLLDLVILATTAGE